MNKHERTTKGLPQGQVIEVKLTARNKHLKPYLRHMNGQRNHWNKIYSTKQLNEMSWTGVITIGTFSYCGPAKFSGLEIK